MFIHFRVPELVMGEYVHNHLQEQCEPFEKTSEINNPSSR